MNWAVQNIEIKLGGDLHCGDLPLGFVARTLPYVPCHLPFFALVPAAVRTLRMPDQRASYKAVEALFSRTVRTTALLIKDGNRILFPWEGESLRRIEGRYLGSRYGVALSSKSRSARDSCLYETEVILRTPHTSRDAKGRLVPPLPTVMSGAIFTRAGEEGELRIDSLGRVSWQGHDTDLPHLLRGISLGGDRTRSLGAPPLEAKAELCRGKLWDLYSVITDGDYPGIEVKAGYGGPLPLSMDSSLYQENSDESIEGTPMVLTGRRYTDKGPGTEMESVATPAFAPGWRMRKDCAIRLVAPRYSSLS